MPISEQAEHPKHWFTGDLKKGARLAPDQVRPVQVKLDDGTWVAGDLVGYQERLGLWWGYVRHPLARAECGLEWFDESRVRAPEQA